MSDRPHRIVLDTNIFIYFLISDTFQKIDIKLRKQKAILLFSEELFTEFIEVVERPKFKKYFSENDIMNLIEGLKNYAEFIEVKSNINICKDINDNFLLNLCIDGKADFLITGDEDLLKIKKIKNTTIIKIAEYIQN